MPDPNVISPLPRVTVLMGVKDGAQYLPAQLSSLAAQDHVNWQLIVSDDGSTDASLTILHDFAQQHPGKVKIVSGPRRGFAENYMSLIRRLPPNNDLVAFADQDDVWLPQKLSRAVTALWGSEQKPTLYCGRQLCWWEVSQRKIASPKRQRAISFRNALVENIASGNTIVLNPAAAELAKNAASRTMAGFAHDWWLYLLITSCGGKVLFDNDAPAILYRQHGSNTIGCGTSLHCQIARKIGVLAGQFSNRIDANIAALHPIEDLMTDEARQLLHRFERARKFSALRRIQALWGIKPYRQTVAGTFGFWGAASLGKA